MLLNVSRLVVTTLLAVCSSLTTQAQTSKTTQTVNALSPTAVMVQSMGLADIFRTEALRLQSLPNHARKTASRLLALEQKMISLPEAEFVEVFARVLDAGLPASDMTLLTDYYTSELGKKLTRFFEQAQAAVAKDKSSTPMVHLASLMQTLSTGERQALETFVATGVTERLGKLVESDSFEDAFMLALEALPVTGR